MICGSVHYLSPNSFAILQAVILGVTTVIAALWIAAVVGTVKYGPSFEAARVSQVLTWILLIVAPLIGAIFFFAIRPRLKRARAEDAASL